MGSTWAAKTRPARVAEPVVSSTSQGSASMVIWVPNAVTAPAA